MNRAANFIGYPTVERFAEHAALIHESVNCMLVTEPGATSAQGLRSDKLVVVVSQVDEVGDTHYVRIPVGAVSFIGKELFDPDHTERRARAKRAYELVRDQLAMHFTLREAMVAMPIDYRLLEGTADFLGWDRESKQYFFKEANT